MARLLVAEDDPDIQVLVSFNLKKIGHLVATADDGAQAIDVVQEKGLPDLAILDVNMPRLSGLEVLQRLREMPGGRYLPAVFLSGRVLPADIERGRSLGARYLTKPFIANALLDNVRELLDHSCAPGGEW